MITLTLLAEIRVEEISDEDLEKLYNLFNAMLGRLNNYYLPMIRVTPELKFEIYSTNEERLSVEELNELARLAEETVHIPNVYPPKVFL